MSVSVAAIMDDGIPTTSRASGVASTILENDALHEINEGAATTFESKKNPSICHYFLRGMCRFGPLCHFSHDIANAEANDIVEIDDDTNKEPSLSSSNSSTVIDGPSTSRCKDWINAPVFIPKFQRLTNDDQQNSESVDDVNGVDDNDVAGSVVGCGNGVQSWAEIVGGGKKSIQNTIIPTESGEELCPYENPCPYGQCCSYALHYELCEMCDNYCLHPHDLEQRRKHNKDCLQQHEQAMELSFAIARSKDKQCGICFDTIMEKSGREKRFGILPNCWHIFCLECIRKWRQAKQFEHKITRSCPECRVSSDFVCPSVFWVDTQEEKDRLLNDYRSALGVKDCKYFKKGEGKCPFGNKCFYKHALPNGDLVDVGCPKRARKLHSGLETGLIDLLDIYLWDYVDQRDYHWLELLSNEDSDDNNSNWSDN